MTDNEFEIREYFLDPTTPGEVFNTWRGAVQRWPELKLVLCGPGVQNLKFPARRRFGNHCVLASPFADDRFAAMDARVFRESASTGRANVNWTHEVYLDTNALSLIESWMAGKMSPQVENIVDFLRSVNGNEFNWNSAPYVIENSRMWAEAGKLDSLYRTILAHERLQDIDRNVLINTGEPSWADPLSAQFRAQQQMAEWHYRIQSAAGRPMVGLCDEAYMLLLAIADIQLKYQSPVAAKKKVGLLLEFLDSRIHQINLMVLLMAWEVFSSPPGSVYYFRQVVSRGSHLKGVLRNMAWDLMLVIEQHRSLIPRWFPAGTFSIPYVLTCDQGVDWLLNLDPLTAVVWGDNWEYPITFPKRNRAARLKEICGEQLLEQFYSNDATRSRAGHGAIEMKHAACIINELEGAVSC